MSPVQKLIFTIVLEIHVWTLSRPVSTAASGYVAAVATEFVHSIQVLKYLLMSWREFEWGRTVSCMILEVSASAADIHARLARSTQTAASAEVLLGQMAQTIEPIMVLSMRFCAAGIHPLTEHRRLDIV